MAPRTAMSRPAGRMPPPSAQRAQATPVRTVAPMLAEADQDDDIVSAELAGPPRSRRRGTLLPNPGGRPFGFSTGGLIVLQPITIAAFLLASFGAAAIISIMIISFDRGGVKIYDSRPDGADESHPAMRADLLRGIDQPRRGGDR